MRQTAWLNTTPEKQNRPRRETHQHNLPEIDAGGHLLEILFEIGPTKPAGMGGQIGIDEADLYAWQCNQGIGLTAWETKAIRQLSREYAAMLVDATSPNCPAPYMAKSQISDDQRDRIAKAMSSWADKLNKTKRHV